MTVHCAIHKGDVPDGVRAVLVDATEQGSGPGIPIYACQPCVDQHGIVPFSLGEDEHARIRPGLGAPPTGIRRAP